MVLQLYTLNLSPPCRAVIMTLKALGLEFEEKAVDVTKGEQLTPEYLALNPRGKIPFLKDCDFLIGESRAISCYLCNKYEKKNGGNLLFPTDPEQRGMVDQFLYISECTYACVASYVNIAGVFFGNGTTQKDKIPEVKKVLDLYEKYLSKSTFIAGENLTIADFHMSSSLLLLDLTDYNDFDDYPKTSAWLAKIKALPYFDACNKNGMKTFKNAYQMAVKRNSK
ncbi:glutathione S-transferase 1-like [Clavelina lepadiformis]|uniref:Glutathione S-transferase n=1 Tax=Clavelina lepadiformis TaxID=159417 RepID=A0ABP0FEZ6_CLALP